MVMIGRTKVHSSLVLAPMAGVNCTSFRLLCKQNGAGLIYTQMYHAAFIEQKEDMSSFMNILDEERPVTIQIIGNKAGQMVLAAKKIERFADIIDINFGCCDPDMIKARCGGYFAMHTDEAANIVADIVASVDKPVTAKIRIGWDSQSINGVLLAQKLEKAGISAIAVHGRTVEQKYAGKANWQIIRHIKEKLSIPVIGNGDINNAQKALEMLRETGCDLVMIGRRAMGDPGIFARCSKKINGTDTMIPDARMLFFDFVRYYDKFDHSKSFTEFKTHALWFAKRGALGPAKRRMIANSKDIDEIIAQFTSNV